MLIQELNRSECLAVLQRNAVGRLGYALFDQPYIVPIHFSFDAERECLYGFSMVGEKVACMRQNPRVCLEVDEILDQTHWRSVLVVGRYSEIPYGNRGNAEELRRVETLFRKRGEWWLPGTATLRSKEREHAVIYRIAIDRVTGRGAAKDIRPTTAASATA